MISLLFATLFSSLFGLIIRYAQRKDRHLLAVGMINYVTATTLYGILILLRGGFYPSPSTRIIGLVAGVVYATAYLFLVPAMYLKGVSIAAALMRLSALIPILFSVFLWGEQPLPIQVLGISLALIALSLLGMDRNTGTERVVKRSLWLMGALFVTNGGCLSASKTFFETGLQFEKETYFLILFGMAAIVSSAAWLINGGTIAKEDVAPGVVLGLSNAFANLLLLLALTKLPGVVVFPFTSAVGLVLTTVFAVVAWREKLGRMSMAGIAIAVVAVLCINK